jgi:hypothetical protein
MGVERTRGTDAAHQGYRMQGRTPYQAFLDGVKHIFKVKDLPCASRRFASCERSHLEL